VEAADVWTVFQGLGAILAVALTVGFAVKTSWQKRRGRSIAASRAAEGATTHLESTVSELVEVLSGKPGTVLNKKGTPGLIDRFDAIEAKVDAHDSKLEDIAAGVATLLEQRA